MRIPILGLSVVLSFLAVIQHGKHSDVQDRGQGRSVAKHFNDHGEFSEQNPQAARNSLKSGENQILDSKGFNVNTNSSSTFFPVSHALHGKYNSSMAFSRTPSLLGRASNRMINYSNLQDDNVYDQTETDAFTVVDPDQSAVQPLDEADHNEKKTQKHENKIQPLGFFSFAISDISYGTQEDNVTPLIPSSFSVDSTVKGPPDFPVSPEQAGKYRGKVLWLGIGGELTLEVAGGAVVDRPGNDFAIFSVPDGYPKQPARIAVASDENPDQWHYFECDCSSHIGCASAIGVTLQPHWIEQRTSGDYFDLANIGVDHINQIKIEGCDNPAESSSRRGDGHKAGAAIDTIVLYHAEKNITTNQEGDEI